MCPQGIHKLMQVDEDETLGKTLKYEALRY